MVIITALFGVRAMINVAPLRRVFFLGPRLWDDTENGGGAPKERGPATRPNFISLDRLAETISGCWEAKIRLGDIRDF